MKKNSKRLNDLAKGIVDESKAPATAAATKIKEPKIKKHHHDSKINDFVKSKGNVLKLQNAIQKTVNLTQVSKLWTNKPKSTSSFNLRRLGNNLMKFGDFMNKNVVGEIFNIQKKFVNLPGMIFRRKDIDELDDLDIRYLTIHVLDKLEFKGNSVNDVLETKQ